MPENHRRFAFSIAPPCLRKSDHHVWQKPRPKREYFNTGAVKQNLKQRAVQGGATTAIGQAVKFGLTVGSTAILARLLTPEDYGLVAMVTVITGFIANFYYLGLSTATIQREEIDHDQVSTLFWVNVAASTGMALLVAMLAPVLSWFYSEPRLTWITVTLAAAFVLMGLGVQHQALLNRQMRFGALAASDVIATLGGIVVGIACASAGLAYQSLVAAQLTTAALSSALLWWFCRWRPHAAGSLSRVYPMLRFGGAITGFQVVNYFARNGDNFLIGRFHGSQELGLYSRAYNLLLFPLMQILSPIASVALPTLSRMNGEAFRAAFLRMARVACVLSMPLVAFTIGTADLIIEIFLGAQWHQAANIFAWLGFLGLVQPIANTSGWVFVAQGRAKEQFYAGIINGTTSILSFLVGLPWGGTGVAAAYAVSGDSYPNTASVLARGTERRSTNQGFLCRPGSLSDCIINRPCADGHPASNCSTHHHLGTWRRSRGHGCGVSACAACSPAGTARSA